MYVLRQFDNILKLLVVFLIKVVFNNLLRTYFGLLTRLVTEDVLTL